MSNNTSDHTEVKVKNSVGNNKGNMFFFCSFIYKNDESI